MSEYLDMVMDGILCEDCGVFISAESSDYSRKCTDCSGVTAPCKRKKRRRRNRNKTKAITHELTVR